VDRILPQRCGNTSQGRDTSPRAGAPAIEQQPDRGCGLHRTSTPRQPAGHRAASLAAGEGVHRRGPHSRGPDQPLVGASVVVGASAVVVVVSMVVVGASVVVGIPTAGKFGSFTGLAPGASETGNTDRKGQPISKAGKRLLRTTLVRAADTARRLDPQLAACVTCRRSSATKTTLARSAWLPYLCRTCSTGTPNSAAAEWGAGRGRGVRGASCPAGSRVPSGCLYRRAMSQPFPLLAARRPAHQPQRGQADAWVLPARSRARLHCEVFWIRWPQPDRWPGRRSGY
jgi:hypothetical protein